MKIVLLVLLFVAGHSYGNGWVENGKYRYDFGNDYLNNNTRFGKAQPKYYNNPSRVQVQPIQIRQYVPQPRKHNCVGSHCLKYK
jgi:hypothetical protein